LSSPDKRGGVLQMRSSALFKAKNFGFFEIYGVLARTRGGRASADILQTRGQQKVSFSQLRADVFYGWSIDVLKQEIRHV